MTTRLQEAIEIYNTNLDEFNPPTDIFGVGEAKASIVSIIEKMRDSTIVVQTCKLRSEIMDILRTNNYI